MKSFEDHAPPKLGSAEEISLENSTDGAHGRPQEVPVEPVISLDVGKLVLANDPGSMKKNLGALTMIAVCFNICNSWAGLATSVQIALLQGGPAALIYGLFVSTSIYICIALTIGELASVYPTAGGQMHFTSILAPKSINRAVSYIDSVLTVFSWIAIGAAVTMIPSQQIIALAQFYHPSLEVHPWLYFVIYQAFGALVATYNILFLKRAPSFHTIGLALTVTLFLTIMITVLARSTPKASSTFVWATFINYTGWPDGVCFFTSLLTTCFCYGGLDASLHLAEEAPNPRVTVPRASVSAIVIGFCTAFPFAISLLYSISDFEAVVAIQGYLPFEINRAAMRSDAAATVFLAFSIVLAFFVLNAIFQTSTRITWSFARDDGLLFSKVFQKVHPTLDSPVNATLLNWATTAICGCIFLGSSTAFNALLASTVTVQLLSFVIPAALLIYRRRSEKYLPRNRAFPLPNWLGWTVNLWTMLGGVLVCVFFFLPPFLPVTGSNMNYNCVVLAVAALIGAANWFLHARNHYQGPRIVFHE